MKLILLTALVLYLGCQGDSQYATADVKNSDSRILVFHGDKLERCSALLEIRDSITFSRDFEVLKNSFRDTINLAFNWIPPGQTGKYFNFQNDTLVSESLDQSEYYLNYIRKNSPELLRTKTLCLYRKGNHDLSANDSIVVKLTVLE
jgi:hypothetical protein